MKKCKSCGCMKCKCGPKKPVAKPKPVSKPKPKAYK